ncbi:BON domain-containing protein [Bradyrhizobium symbiodeficiens]|uniref:BON domain-containing protein n=1 Tax=Bradyrhizobium symbiodeficiens TaxID=1404367 RepID=A0AAJ6N4H7_9BRAD
MAAKRSSTAIMAPSPCVDPERFSVAMLPEILPVRVLRPQPIGLNVSVKDCAVTLRGVVRGENAHRAVVVTCENVPGVRRVDDRLCVQSTRPDPEDDYGGGDFVSLQMEPSTLDDEPL